MDYEEIQALESYRKQADAATEAWRREREATERAAAERRERERVAKLETLKAHLAEIVPPALLPLVRYDDDADVRTGIWYIPFIYDEQEILKLVFYVNANMTVDFREIVVPDARLCEVHCEYSVEWAADMVYKNNAFCIETTEGSRYGAEHWEFATARAFEVLHAYREYAQRAAQHNAEQVERRAEERIIKQVFGADASVEVTDKVESLPLFIVIEDVVLSRFEAQVNQYLTDGWQLHGSMQVVAPPDEMMSYVQALVRPEVA